MGIYLGAHMCKVGGVMRLEVIIEGEVTSCRLLRGASLLLGLVCAGHDSGLLVLADALLEEVGLAAQGDVLHEVEGVGGVVDLVVAEGDQQAVSDKLNVLLHESRVHAEKSAGQRLGQELLLNGDSIGDDLGDNLLAGTVLEVRVQQASEVSV